MGILVYVGEPCVNDGCFVKLSRALSCESRVYIDLYRSRPFLNREEASFQVKDSPI